MASASVTPPVYIGLSMVIEKTGKRQYNAEFCVAVHDGHYIVDVQTQGVPIVVSSQNGAPAPPEPASHDGSNAEKYSLISRRRSLCLSGNVCTVVRMATELRVYADEHEEPFAVRAKVEDFLISWLRTFTAQNNVKILAAGLPAAGYGDQQRTEFDRFALETIPENKHPHLADAIERYVPFTSRLWLELDVLPCVVDSYGKELDEQADSLVRRAIRLFGPDNIPRLELDYLNRVHVDADEMPILSLSDYRRVTSPALWRKIEVLAAACKKRSLRVSFFNSTAQGGGVALMRHSLMRFFKLLGVDVRWYVMRPVPFVFLVTKSKFHNVLQGAYAPGDEPGLELTDEDKGYYLQWCQENAERHWTTVFANSDIIILDDPQTIAMAPFVKKYNANARLFFRSHIQIRSDLVDRPGTLQNRLWCFLDEYVRLCNWFVCHPVPEFVPATVPRHKVLYLPASTDPLDGLNKPLGREDVAYYQSVLLRVCRDHDANLVDFARPIIVQISRFDPSKGIKDAIQSVDMLRTEYLQNWDAPAKPQLLLCGVGSVDDPDGTRIYFETLDYLEYFPDLKKDCVVIRLPPSDQLLNTALRSATVALQLSHWEGFEVKVTEALMKGIPVIAYRSGGIPLQMTDFDENHPNGGNGFLVERGNVRGVAERLFRLFTDRHLADDMKRFRGNHEEFLTPNMAACWMGAFLATEEELTAAQRATDLLSNSAK